MKSELTSPNPTTNEETAWFPTTRYQGSKRKLARAILDQLTDLHFTSVLDAFGGTGVIAHAFKKKGKRVTYNDALAFNHQIGVALIENDAATLSEGDVKNAMTFQKGISYDNFIERTFEDIYFTCRENAWLDVTAQNIRKVRCRFKRALLYYALFQSAMIKRPYNLFHRKNLYMRTASVQRSFGNKATWDRPFADHFAKFASEANTAIIDGHGTCDATCGDAINIEREFDLVYIDPPYVNRSGTGVDYHHFYHFLEGLVRYNEWPALIDMASKHRRMRVENNPWCDRSRNGEMFSKLFERFSESTLVVSYRSDGTPTIGELKKRLQKVKRKVRVIEGKKYQYALSTNRRSREVLLVGR